MIKKSTSYLSGEMIDSYFFLDSSFRAFAYLLGIIYFLCSSEFSPEEDFKFYDKTSRLVGAVEYTGGISTEE